MNEKTESVLPQFCNKDNLFYQSSMKACCQSADKNMILDDLKTAHIMVNVFIILLLDPWLISADGLWWDIGISQTDWWNELWLG